MELTVFLYDGDDDLFSSFLEATVTSTGCDSSQECAVGSVCIDGKCWADTDDNPAITDGAWPVSGDCLFIHVNDARPVILEVTDNGLNDFDLEMSYNLQLRARCGCPAECDGANNACQGTPAP